MLHEAKQEEILSSGYFYALFIFGVLGLNLPTQDLLFWPVGSRYMDSVVMNISLTAPAAQVRS